MSEWSAYRTILLGDEINSIEGEIDEQALAEKRSLLESQCDTNRACHLESYGRSSFAGTAAEYVHCLWHDVSIRSGADYLPPQPLRRRLELLARWFPPDRGYRLFPAGRDAGLPPQRLS